MSLEKNPTTGQILEHFGPILELLTAPQDALNDFCVLRGTIPPSRLAQINSAVLALMDRLGVRNVPQQMRFFDAEIDQALDLVLIGQCSVF